MVDGVGEPSGGPWGALADIILCVLPLVFLMVVTLSQRWRMPTVTSLPVAAFLMWFIRLVYLGSPSNEVHAAVVIGVLDALTPLCIIGGAILLFSTMQHTMCLPWIIQKIKRLSGGHPVAEVFLIGWAFAYLIEGASGFGTPVALAAPMLAELGHSPMSAVVCVLIMNTLATPYGAVGTPIWFGFDGLGLSDKDLLKVSFQVSVIDGVAALVVPVIAASFLVSWESLWKSKLFILMSIASCVLPAIGLSVVSYEFSSILGGLLGTGITAILASKGIGLEKRQSRTETTTAIQEEVESPVAVQVSLLAQTSSTPFSSTLAPTPEVDESRKQASMPRRCSINVASLSREPHLKREDSVESTPGDFIHTDLNTKVQDERNRMLFPITYDPLNFRKRLVTRGCQTSLQDDSPALQVSTSPPMDVAFDDVPISGADKSASEIQGSPGQLEFWGQGGSTAWQGLQRMFPLWATVLLLIVTRVPQLGIKSLLQKVEPSIGGQLGSLGNFQLSPALVMTLKDVLGETSAKWQFQLLYVPFFLPFVVVSGFTLLMFRRDIHSSLSWTSPFLETFLRVKSIIVALVGALVLVSLIRKGGNGAPAFIIGSVMAKYLKSAFICFSPLLGALGSFFSGSTTVSNLTFGTVQLVAAEQMGRPVVSMLALQSMGGTMGNMICINNIISARTVLRLEQSEGDFIKKTAPVAVVFYIIGTLVGLIFVL